MSPPDLEKHPVLAASVRWRIDPVSGEPVLLFPEGLLVLNATAHEIVRRCTGLLSIGDLIQELSAEFDVGEDALRTDVLENLAELQRLNLVVFRP